MIVWGGFNGSGYFNNGGQYGSLFGLHEALRAPMPWTVVLALLLAAPPLSLAERVDGGARSVERARDAFVLGATRPFDEVYPRSVFEKKVQRELAEERVLSRVFGMEVTPALLAAEYERIEKETRAPDQGKAIKKALGGDRRMIEEVVCRPCSGWTAPCGPASPSTRLSTTRSTRRRGPRQRGRGACHRRTRSRRKIDRSPSIPRWRRCWRRSSRRGAT